MTVRSRVPSGLFTDYWTESHVLPDGIGRVVGWRSTQPESQKSEDQLKLDATLPPSDPRQASSEPTKSTSEPRPPLPPGAHFDSADPTESKRKLVKEIVSDILAKREANLYSPIQLLLHGAPEAPRKFKGDNPPDKQPPSVPPYARLSVTVRDAYVELKRKQADIRESNTQRSGELRDSAESRGRVADKRSNFVCCQQQRVDADEMVSTAQAANANVVDPTGIPPFFAFVRMFLNDIPVYQTQLATLDEGVPEKFPFQASESLADDEELVGNYSMYWGSSVVVGVDSPGDYITLHLLDKDFCPDLEMSEDSLAAVTVPVASILVGRKYDLLLHVSCTLPTSLSLGSLLLAADKAATLDPKAKNKDAQLLTHLPDLIHVPPTVLQCRVRLQISLESRGTPLFLCELASLALPSFSPIAKLKTAGIPATTESEVSQATLLSSAATTILGSMYQFKVKDKPAAGQQSKSTVAVTPSPISLTAALKLLFALAWVLISASDDDSNAEVLRIALKDTLRSKKKNANENMDAKSIVKKIKEMDDETKTNGIDYGQLVANFVCVVDHLLIGPLYRVFKLISDLIQFQYPLLTTFMLIICWMQFFIPQFVRWPLRIVALTYAAFAITRIHIAHPVMTGDGKDSNIAEVVNSAKSLIASFEATVIRGTLLVRLQILDLWLEEMVMILKKHPLSGEHVHSELQTLIAFVRSSLGMKSVLAICVSLFISRFVPLLIALLGSFFLLQNFKPVAICRRVIRGVHRYNQLQRIRKECAIP